MPRQKKKDFIIKSHRDLTRSMVEVCRLKSVAPTSKISEPNPDSVLFSLIYELDVCNVGDPFVFDVCRDTERIKL